MALAARLRTELDRIDRLLEAFLVLARAQHRSLPGQAVLPLDYMTANALTGQAAAISARKLTVQEVSEPGGAWAAGSQALISRMVENVIDNAVCHNTDGGWIRITSGTADGRASVVVENGGPVLEQDQVRELSQPFRRIGADRTGSDSGSGLGLSIVAAIAEAHGGSLDLQARPEGGLRVSIQLPAAAVVLEITESLAKLGATIGVGFRGGCAGRSPRMRILVVEDSRSLAEVLVEGLRDQGMAVDAAHDGLEAVAKLDLNAYDVVGPDDAVLTVGHRRRRFEKP